jgi:hypothetical protein
MRQRKGRRDGQSGEKSACSSESPGSRSSLWWRLTCRDRLLLGPPFLWPRLNDVDVPSPQTPPAAGSRGSTSIGRRVPRSVSSLNRVSRIGCEPDRLRRDTRLRRAKADPLDRPYPAHGALVVGHDEPPRASLCVAAQRRTGGRRASPVCLWWPDQPRRWPDLCHFQSRYRTSLLNGVKRRESVMGAARDGSICFGRQCRRRRISGDELAQAEIHAWNTPVAGQNAVVRQFARSRLPVVAGTSNPAQSKANWPTTQNAKMLQ